MKVRGKLMRQMMLGYENALNDNNLSKIAHNDIKLELKSLKKSYPYYWKTREAFYLTTPKN